MNRTYVGFGFGAIQGGLMLYEAWRSGNFKRLVVAEVMPEMVAALRAGGGRYRLNVATPTGLEQHTVEGVEVYDPSDHRDRAALIAAVAEAEELSTALPSIDFYDRGGASVVSILAAGLARQSQTRVLYACENHNHAAERLTEQLAGRLAERGAGLAATGFQALNTVIGKMSGVVTDPDEISRSRLATIAGGLPRAFLVEAFNRILVSRVADSSFVRGIEVFAEKDDLLPFEEAKLYGHNAVHALLGYLAHEQRCRFMSEIADNRELMQLGREAFLEESGRALIVKYARVDDLFTEDGFRAYAEDLLERMVNPFLRDAVVRIIRDPRRKLGWNDRLVGTMRLALSAGIQPRRFARGAAAALRVLGEETRAEDPAQLLDEVWATAEDDGDLKRTVKELIVHER